MRHLAAFLLLAVGGNATPSAEEITNVLSQAGIESDPERLTALLAELDGKDINEIIALGKEKLMAGGAMAAAGGAAPAAAAGAGKHLISFFNPTSGHFRLQILIYCVTISFSNLKHLPPPPRQLRSPLRRRSMHLTEAWTCSVEAVPRPGITKHLVSRPLKNLAVFRHM